jgi:hypothetical protein
MNGKLAKITLDARSTEFFILNVSKVTSEVAKALIWDS